MNRQTPHRKSIGALLTALAGTAALLDASPAWPQGAAFHLQEATIADVQGAIQGGQITCKGLVEAYIRRARAYNGICTALVTSDGKSIPAATGKLYGGTVTKFPTKTVSVADVLPDVAQYQGAAT